MKRGSISLNRRQKVSLQWHHPTSAWMMQFKATPSAVSHGHIFGMQMDDFGRQCATWSDH
jgi:hypothetical protein